MWASRSWLSMRIRTSLLKRLECQEMSKSQPNVREKMSGARPDDQKDQRAWPLDHFLD